MAVEGTALIAILGMAIVTAATRLGGYWLAERVELSPRTAAALDILPGAILTAIVAPAVVAEGINGALAALAAVLVMRRSGSLLLTLLTGVGAVWLLRNAL